MADSALQRKNMVESQVRPSDVTDRRITAAMSDIAREAFVPAGIDKTLAYMDGAIPLGGGRALMAPRTLARLLQLAALEREDKVLIVGGLTGYSAAITARMAQSVVVLEAEEALSRAAREALAGLGAKNAEVVTGDLAKGHAAAAPYDVILIEGTVEEVPEALLSQLQQGGRLIAVEAGTGLGRAAVYTKTAATISRRTAFEAAAAALPGFARLEGFVF